MTNLLQHILVPFLGVASGVVDFGGRHTDAYATASHDDKHIDAQEKINMFEIIPYTSPSHPYIGLSHPYSGPSYLSLPLCSHCKCNECMDRQDKLFEKIEAITKAFEELKSKRGVMLSKKLVYGFEWDEDMINYVRRKRPYLHGKDWTKAKRILAVINVEEKYILSIEILLEEGMMNVYDYNLLVFDEANFFTKMQPMLTLFPNLLR
ncbi:hypothetical protein FXO38_36469 [Capsicum annuum]|nr:hypothetical protein FXO38_36469 [Capsicum annuum]